MTAGRWSVRVYYEDVDLAGVVYYANHLRFLERGRTEALRAAGVDQRRLKAESGIVFVVVRVAIDYRSPAFFDDLLTVETAVARLGGASIDMRQRLSRGETTIAEAQVRCAALGPDGAARRLPPAVRAAVLTLA